MTRRRSARCAAACGRSAALAVVAAWFLLGGVSGAGGTGPGRAATADRAEAARPAEAVSHMDLSKKLIATGWDMPDTARLRAHLAEMERRPFDGVVLEVLGRRGGPSDAGEGASGGGGVCRLRWAFSAEPWKESWFETALADLRAVRSRRLTENFVLVNANPGDVDWFDDAGWRQIVDHFRLAARLARRGGLRGILFDPEPYTPPHAPFRYAAQPGRDRHSFAAYAAQVRRRGREMMEAMAAEFPDMTLFCYFLNSVCRGAAGQPDPTRVLEGHPYGLLPAFLDGWLDAAPPTVTFVDGCESAYLFNSDRQYLEAAAAIRGACQRLISPENRAKYRAQVQVGFGVYLDAYWNPRDSEWGRWYVDGLGGPRVERLRHNVETALRLADRYVWIYGEKFRWWPTPNRSVRAQTWPEALPGVEDALAWARDPADWARRCTERLQKAGRLRSLLRGGDFPRAERVGGRPVGWGAWQRSDSKGTFGWDGEVGRTAPGAARAAGVADGCFLQAVEVQPGRRYAVRGFYRLRGRGRAWIRVRWQTADGRWTAEARDRILLADRPAGSEPGPDGWTEVFGAVEVPRKDGGLGDKAGPPSGKPSAAVGRLVVLLVVRDQKGPDDVAWFDDVAVYPLDAP